MNQSLEVISMENKSADSTSTIKLEFDSEMQLNSVKQESDSLIESEIYIKSEPYEDEVEFSIKDESNDDDMCSNDGYKVEMNEAVIKMESDDMSDDIMQDPLNVNPNTKDTSASTDNNKEPDQLIWNNKKVKLLLDLYKERKEQFRDKHSRKKTLWSEIANHMVNCGYKVNEAILDSKFRNLKKTFRTIKTNDKICGSKKSITWEYYDIFEDIFNGDETLNCELALPSKCPEETGLAKSQSVVSLLKVNQGSPVMTPTLTAASSTTQVKEPPNTSNSDTATVSSSHPFKSAAAILPFVLDFDSDLNNISGMVSEAISLSTPISSTLFDQSDLNSTSDSSDSVIQTPSKISSKARNKKRKRVSSREEDLREKILIAEEKRVEALERLVETFSESNKINSERNELLKLFIEKIKNSPN